MSRHEDVKADTVLVEVYMAMQHAPEVYDLFITRGGVVRPNRLAKPMQGLLQVVMAGMNPTAAQQLRIASHFGNTSQFRILKFY
jgi:hypothetical protein